MAPAHGREACKNTSGEGENFALLQLPSLLSRFWQGLVKTQAVVATVDYSSSKLLIRPFIFKTADSTIHLQNCRTLSAQPETQPV